MALFDNQQILLEYYNIICKIRDILEIKECNVCDINKFEISTDIYKYYCNYNAINNFTLLLLNKLNSKYKEYYELNIEIINIIKIQYIVLFPSVYKKYESQIHLTIFHNTTIEKKELNNIIYNIVYDTVCISISKLNIRNIKQFINIIEQNELDKSNDLLIKLNKNSDIITELLIKLDEKEGKIKELLIKLNIKEEQISILEAEYYPLY